MQFHIVIILKKVEVLKFFIFDDRMEVKNPGSLLSSISVEDLVELKGVHQSRNTVASRVLREIGYMRELGEGMRRIFSLMRENELTPPEISSQKNSFSVILRHKTIYSAAERLWLDNFRKFNLSREQKAIVVLGMGERLIAPQVVWDRLGIVDTEHYRQLIKSLQDLRILHSEIPKRKAQQEAKKKKTGVRIIPRFKILLPTLRNEPKSPSQILKRVENTTGGEDSPSEGARLWVGNVPPNANEKELIEYFNNHGEVQYFYMPRNYDGDKSKGYAFVEFESADVSTKIMNEINGEVFRNYRLSIRKARPRKL